MTNLQIVQTNPPPGFIDLGAGNPDDSLLPIELIRHSTEAYFATGDTRSLQYGFSQGDGNFRQSLANYLTMAFNSSVAPDELFVTAGASSALDLLCTLFTNPGDVVLVEEPSYFLALSIFKDHGLRVVPVPFEGDRLNLDIFEKRIIEFKPKMFYTIPTFQNPSGRTLSQKQREKLVSLAQQHNVFIVADEVYHLLGYSKTPPHPFAIYAKDVEQIISVNSFSKILAPGLRLGWIQANSKVINQLADSGLLDSGGGMNPFMSALVYNLIETGGLEENINNLRQEYSSRLNAMATALSEHLPSSEWVLPQGGFFFWIRLPDVDAAEFREKAKEYQVGIRQGNLFSGQDGMRNFFRISFCFYKPVEIEEGIKRLGKCLSNYELKAK